jgi:site-specific DNA recombinase
MSGRGRAILYARVSTGRQARSGYSLAQQMEALREYAAHAGYEVLQEVAEAGESGASLQRPGMDRVRDLVAAGGISAVLAQDLDRFARDPELHEHLRHEFSEHGCALVALDDPGATGAQLAKRERAKLAERTLRGKLRKAREGKILAGTTPNYGFRFNRARDGYEVDEAKMRVVRRIFRMVGAEKRSLNAIKKTLEADGVPAPSGNKRWQTWVIRRFILDDLYKPHTVEEIAELVTPEVAARLDPAHRYGVWWFNRERWTSQQVSEVSGNGRLYRRSVRTVTKPKEEWVAVPIPDAGVPREIVDAAQEVVLNNKPNSNGGDRFWELSSGILRCGDCGRRMRTCVTRKNPNKRYFYYACAKHREGRGVCPNRRSYRAEVLEDAVRRAVGGLLADPERVREGFEARLRRECSGARGDPNAQEGALLRRLTEVDRTRSRYQEMTAKGLMTFDELRARLEELEGSREAVLQELEEVRRRRESAQRLVRDEEALLESYAGTRPESLEVVPAEERRRVYRMLQLEVLVSADGSLSVDGIAGSAVLSALE